MSHYAVRPRVADRRKGMRTKRDVLYQFYEAEGTVISIGLRSTRILSVEGEIISIPNAQFSQLSLLNESRRDRFLLKQTVRLSYETTPEQIKFILARLRELILAYPKVAKD